MVLTQPDLSLAEDRQNTHLRSLYGNLSTRSILATLFFQVSFSVSSSHFVARDHSACLVHIHCIRTVQLARFSLGAFE